MLAINVGTTYGALGSDASALVAVLDVSENVDVRGTDPVKRTVMTPSASNAMPSDLEKYTSKDVGSRTSGERRVMMILGDTTKGKACSASQPAVPYV